ncbi:tyrosine-type recombinase/integrase [Aureivirga sp. CE67]|uniref:tyrosine-type recombinase/integrase n=1 Tax=Aureivirga sp. CE67 TaxID=1788983 RepID=UPI0018CB2FA2|nr:tyrosine-type recombinase/integrase [Aureivirga sp. CE67]
MLFKNIPNTIASNNLPDFLFKEDLLITKFLNEQDVSESTRKIYQRTIKKYFKFLKDKEISLSEVDREILINYKEFLIHEDLSVSTINGYLIVVRLFYQWTENREIFPNIARGIKILKRKQGIHRKQHLTKTNSQELLEQYSDKEKLLSLRNFAIINLMLRTGLRGIEVTRIRISDISWKYGKRILKVQGKGKIDKEDYIILTNKAYVPILNYLQARENRDSIDYIFVSTSNNSKGKVISTRTIREIVKKAMIEIGLDGKEFSAHSLRHTTAVNILKAGGHTDDAQKLLRHLNPATTMIYTNTLEEEERFKNPVENLLDDMI